MNFRLKWLAPMFLVLGSWGAAALDIVKDGASDFVIVLPADAIPAEVTAANELRHYIVRMTGVELPIRNEPQPEGGNLFVGGTGWADREDETRLGQADSVILKVRGREVWIGGARPRGALYAVYTLLEDFWGVRFYSSREEAVPPRTELTLPDPLSYRYTPPFFYRETHYGDVNYNPAFAAKLKSNGHFQEIPAAWGGHVRISEPGFVHTVTRLIPPAEFFAGHPDWYALDENGRRDPAQVCWSHPEMRAELIRAVLAHLAAQPDAKIISVSQMDGWLRCRCDRCRELESQGGSPAAPVIAAVNEVAAAVAETHPGVMVSTLAYLYSQAAPVNMNVRDNVLVQLCAYRNDFSQPYDSAANAEFRTDLENWHKIARNLAIWDYLANFTNYLIPHPNEGTFGTNIRLFAAGGVTSVFAQGDIGSAGCGDFVQLKAWVIAHLLWNPTLDERALTVEFLNGYYSPEAGARLLTVIDRLRDRFIASGRRLGCYHADVNGWLTQREIGELLQLFDAAEAALPETDRAVYAERLRRARLPFDLAYLLTPQASAWNPELTESEYRKNLDLWREMHDLYRRNGVVDLNEITPIAVLYERMPRMLAGPNALRRSGDVPEFCRDSRRFYEFSASDVELLRPGVWTWIDEAPDSPFGQTARLPNDRGDWLLTVTLPELLAGTVPGRHWHAGVRLRARGEGDPAAEAARVGCYDASGNGSGSEKKLTLGELSGDYRWVLLEPIALAPGQQIYVAPETGGWRGELLVERVILWTDAPEGGNP